MISFASLIQTVAVLISAIIVLWIASVAIIQRRTIVPFLPLIAMATSLCGIATVYFFAMQSADATTFFSSCLTVTHIWILVAIVIRLHKRI